MNEGEIRKTYPAVAELILFIESGPDAEQYYANRRAEGCSVQEVIGRYKKMMKRLGLVPASDGRAAMLDHPEFAR